MTIRPENDPLASYGYDPTLTVAEVQDLLDVSDGCARKFLKEHALYLKIGGAVRVPRLGLSRVLFDQGEAATNCADSEIEFPGNEIHDTN